MEQELAQQKATKKANLSVPARDNSTIRTGQFLSSARKKRACIKCACSREWQHQREYRSYTNQDKIAYMELVEQVGVKRVAKLNKIPLSTIRAWCKKDQYLRQKHSNYSQQLLGNAVLTYRSRKQKKGWSWKENFASRKRRNAFILRYGCKRKRRGSYHQATQRKGR